MTTELMMNSLGRKSVENHQLLEGSSSGSDVQEFTLPPKRSTQLRFKRRQRELKAPKPLQTTDIHGCCLVLFILLFIATVVTSGWLCFITVQLQREVDHLKEKSDSQGEVLRSLHEDEVRLSLLVNSSVLRLSEIESLQVVFDGRVTSLQNSTRLVEHLQARLDAQLKQFSATGDQALQGLATVDNEIQQIKSGMKTTKLDVTQLQKAVGPAPDLAGVPAGGEAGLLERVRYLMHNYTWVVSEVALARDSAHAAREAFDTKGADLTAVHRRLSVLESGAETTLTRVNQHRHNLNVLKTSVSDLDRRTLLAGLAVSVAAPGNGTASELPPSLHELGLLGNSSVGDGILAVARMVIHHHHDASARSGSASANTSVASSLAKLEQEVSKLQQQHEQQSLQYLVGDEADTVARCECGDNITLESLLAKADVARLAARVTETMTSLTAGSNSSASRSFARMLALLPNITGSNSGDDLSRLLMTYGQLVTDAAASFTDKDTSPPLTTESAGLPLFDAVADGTPSEPSLASTEAEATVVAAGDKNGTTVASDGKAPSNGAVDVVGVTTAAAVLAAKSTATAGHGVVSTAPAIATATKAAATTTAAAATTAAATTAAATTAAATTAAATKTTTTAAAAATPVSPVQAKKLASSPAAVSPAAMPTEPPASGGDDPAAAKDTPTAARSPAPTGATTEATPGRRKRSSRHLSPRHRPGRMQPLLLSLAVEHHQRQQQQQQHRRQRAGRPHRSHSKHHRR